MANYEYFSIHDLKADLKKHAIRGGGITIFSRMTNFLIQTIATMVLARILAPEEFGLVGMVTALTGSLVISIDMGLTGATIQTSDINHEKISALFWINVIVTGVIVLIAIALSPLVAWFCSNPRLTNIMIISATYQFMAALSAQHIALLKRRMLFSEYPLMRLSQY